MKLQQKLKKPKTMLLTVALSSAVLAVATHGATAQGANAQGANAQGANAQGANAQGTRVFPTDLTNIAAAANGGRILSSSSTFNDDKAYGAANLIDGKIFGAGDVSSRSNGWVSNKYDSVAMESVVIGFADNAQKRLGKLVFNPDSSVAPERWAKDIEVQTSTTSAEGPFRVASQITLKRSAEPQEFRVLPVDARFVKLVFRSNWGSDRAVALGEIEMYESIRTDDAVGQLIASLESAITDLKRYQQAQNELVGATSTQVSAKMAPLNPALMRLIASAPAATVAPDEKVAPAEAAKSVETTTSTRAVVAPVSGRALNIAAAANGGRIADVSSTFNSDDVWSAKNLIDGQNYNLSDATGSGGWASEGFASGKQSVTLGFQDDRTRLIGRIVINPTSNQNSLRWATRVEVQASNGSPTEGPFRTITTLNIRLEAVNQEFEVRPFEAKYVRFVFTANGPGNPLPQGDPNVSSDRAVSLGEIEIYEPSQSGRDLVPIIGRFNQVLVDLKRLKSEDKLGDSN